MHDVIHSKQIWDKLSHRFNTASLARTMDLRRTLTNLSKGPKQSMEEYLRQIKHIADLLVSIRTPISYIDLVQLTLNGLNKDYHNLVTTLSYGTNLRTFDNLCFKLIHYEQRLKFLKSKDVLGVQHQALATSVASTDSDASNCNYTHGNNYGGGKGKGRNNNNRKENKNQGGGNLNSNQPQHQFASRSVPEGTT